MNDTHPQPTPEWRWSVVTLSGALTYTDPDTAKAVFYRQQAAGPGVELWHCATPAVAKTITDLARQDKPIPADLDGATKLANINGWRQVPSS